jgi:hypothetical protein
LYCVAPTPGPSPLQAVLLLLDLLRVEDLFNRAKVCYALDDLAPLRRGDPQLRKLLVTGTAAAPGDLAVTASALSSDGKCYCATSITCSNWHSPLGRPTDSSAPTLAHPGAVFR